MIDIETGVHCLIISLLWGGTNPLIKKSTRDITKLKSNGLFDKFINEIKYLSANWLYVCLFLINQLGSVLYFFLLQKLDLSFIVPTVNALTFLITGLVGFLTGEGAPSLKTLIGVVFILSGITFCVYDKV